jgi:hypothetical protein
MSKLKQAGLSVRVISLVLALATLAVVLGFAVPQPVAALNCGIEIDYYSDASHTTQVGARAWHWAKCGCGAYGWGVTSPYSQSGPTDFC